MKKYWCFLLLVISSCSILNPYYLNLNKEKQNKICLLSPDSVKFTLQIPNEIYSINSKQLKELFNEDKTNFKLIIFFTFWCPNSQEFLPIFMQNISTVNPLKIYLISPDDWIRKPNYISYIKQNNINRNVFLLDVYSYGNKRNPHYRMQKFISEICPECIDIVGFPSLMLYNKENQLIFKYSGKVKADTIKYYILQ